MLLKNELPQNLFLNNQKNYENKQLQYWTYQVDAKIPYLCHLFTLVCNDNDMLNDYWENLTENIAINFQIDIDKEIERWNIYLVFLLENEVPKEIKYKIEQDKYCCRKLVEDSLKTNDFPDTYIAQLIQDKIFSVRHVNKIAEATYVIQSVQKMIQTADEKILPALEGFKSNKQIGGFYKKFKGNESNEEQQY